MSQSQKAARAKIMAWARGDEPDASLPIRTVLDTYIPPDIKGSGQYFTSAQTGVAALENLKLRLPVSPDKLRVLDPCAGIGHLIYLIIFLRPIITLDAYEIEAECVEVGCKLFPWVNWSTGIPFIAIDALEGQYDLVLCNPPIGINRGVEPGKMMCNHRASRSEHLFLELSIRALKPGGQAIILGSANYLESCSARLRAWIQQQQVVIAPPLGPLPGSNRYSSLQLYAYYISRPGGEIVEGSKQIIFKTQPKEIEFKHE